MGDLKKGCRGPEVTYLQKQLNALLSPSPGLKEDGDFGDGTFAAVKRFQSQNGLYADGVAGDRTKSALKAAEHRAPLTIRQRLSAAFDHLVRQLTGGPSPLALLALYFAEQEEGVKEVGGDNRGPRVEEFLKAAGRDAGEPWCLAYVYWSFEKAVGLYRGQNPLRNVPLRAYCPSLWSWANDNGKLITAPKRGDIFLLMTTSYPIVARHTGFVTGVSGQYINTIEGNTNLDGSDNGYAVFRRTRKITSCDYVRI